MQKDKCQMCDVDLKEGQFYTLFIDGFEYKICLECCDMFKDDSSDQLTCSKEQKIF